MFEELTEKLSPVKEITFFTIYGKTEYKILSWKFVFIVSDVETCSLKTAIFPVENYRRCYFVLTGSNLREQF